jgi:hypothetical protein
MRVEDLLEPGTLERLRGFDVTASDWREPFAVMPASVHPEGLNPYEYRVVDAGGITFATSVAKEKADLIARLPELLKLTLAAVQLEAVVSNCDACLDADENICEVHASKAEELSECRFELVMRLAASFEKR